MECQDEKEQIAYPLFYDVEASHIRYQSGPVATAIAKHKTKKQIKEWEKALEGASNLVGWSLKNIATGHEAEAVNIIVEEISQKLRSIHLRDDEDLIGMERRMEELELSLGIGLNDKARIIWITGMGGIGKTTLARAIFDKVSSSFEGCVFVEDIRDVSQKKGLESLQERLLSSVLNDKHMRVDSVHDGKSTMRMRLPYKKVLIVLDNVDDAKQREALAGDWFKDGSRIIITSRYRKLLADGRNGDRIHDVSFLSNEEAMSLFSKHAFKRYIPDEGYEELSSAVVRYAAGLPLAIKVLGSTLHGEKKLIWTDVLKSLVKIPPFEILKVLEISYNNLEDDVKEMFLNVACFLKGWREDDAITMLESCGARARYGLNVLRQKSLVTISDRRLVMHDRLVEMGKNIVRRAYPDEPNKHNRLWILEDIKELFFDDTVTEASTCIGLMLPLKELSPEIIIKRLGNLNKLRSLILFEELGDCFPSDWKFDKTKQYFPNSLRFLFCGFYPGLSLPQTFRANNLVGLDLFHSRIVQFWESGERKVLFELKFLNLSFSMLKTLDLGMSPNLERLELCGCRDLTEIYAPPGCLERLVMVDLCGCRWSMSFWLSEQLESLVLLSLRKLVVSVEYLEKLPWDSSSNLPMLSFSLKYSEEQPPSMDTVTKGVYLDLPPCTKLESVLGSIFGLQNLTHITFKGPIPEVPNDLDRLKCLEQLTLLSTNIKCIPDSVCMLKHLKSLKLKNCKHLEELPENIGWLENLEELKLSSTSIRSLPDSICMLKYLKSLKLEFCGLLEKLPEDIGQLECLEMLRLIECSSLGHIPNSICRMKCLRDFYLPFCSQVEKVPKETGNLKLLEGLDIRLTGISHLPHSISSIHGLLIFASTSLLQSCAFATKLDTSEEGILYQIKAVNGTPESTELKTQSTENCL